MKKLYAIIVSLLFVGSFFGIASILGAQICVLGLILTEYMTQIITGLR